jgi:hypothetical protein
MLGAGTEARERMVGPLTATASPFRQPQLVESFNSGPLCLCAPCKLGFNVVSIDVFAVLSRYAW